MTFSFGKKAALGFALAASALIAAPAQARDGYRGHRSGDDAAIAVGAGMLGLVVGAAIASDRDDRYYDGDYYDGGYYYDDNYYARPRAYARGYPRGYYYRHDAYPRHYRYNRGWNGGYRGGWNGHRGDWGRRGGHHGYRGRHGGW